MNQRDHIHEVRSSPEIAAIRKRPGMYIGGTDFFGIIQYVMEGSGVANGAGRAFATFGIRF